MRESSRLLAAAALVISITIVAGCGNETDEAGSGEDPLPSAFTLGDQVVLTAEEYLGAEPFADANRGRGEKLALQCKACHSLEEGGPNMVGPALYGFFGRQVGSQIGFSYSATMRNASFVWTPRALNAWLAQPGRFLPGNRMAFAGVSRQGEREDLIAYLLEITAVTENELQE